MITKFSKFLQKFKSRDDIVFFDTKDLFIVIFFTILIGIFDYQDYYFSFVVFTFFLFPGFFWLYLEDRKTKKRLIEKENEVINNIYKIMLLYNMNDEHRRYIEAKFYDIDSKVPFVDFTKKV